MEQLRKELAQALQWEQAHVGFENATADLDMETIGDDSHSLPYTIWQLAYHIRYAQRDILEFCIDENYKAGNWPDDYWPDEKVPPSMEEWHKCLQQVNDDRQEMVKLVMDRGRDLFEPFPHGKGQHLFREALLVVDHESYHTGQIVLIRKLLGKWK